MTLENYGSYWVIDHIKPFSMFNLTDRSDFLEVSHYTNLQPLKILHNHIKRDKLLSEEIMYKLKLGLYDETGLLYYGQ